MKKTALITGASGGLGLALANIMSNDYNLVLTYNTNEKTLKDLEQKLKNVTKIKIIKCDLTNDEDIKNLVEESINEFSKIDVLINNAATCYDEPVELKTKETFMKVLDINLVAPFLLSKYVSKHMLEQRQGKIINISSTNGIDTNYPESIDYDASKAGLISLTKNLAKYYAPYITVNAIAPGWIETPMNKDMDENYKKQEEEKILLKRFAKPDEIAHAVLFLCENTYINGTVIRVDGGVI